MSDRVDTLFGAEGGQPQPRIRRVAILLIGGLTLAVLGMICTAAPGGLMVLAAWIVVDKELDRVDSGYLPADVRPQVVRWHRATGAGMIAVLLLFLLQTWLFWQGVYDVLWTAILGAISTWLGGPPAVS